MNNGRLSAYRLLGILAICRSVWKFAPIVVPTPRLHIPSIFVWRCVYQPLVEHPSIRKIFWFPVFSSDEADQDIDRVSHCHCKFHKYDERIRRVLSHRFLCSYNSDKPGTASHIFDKKGNLSRHRSYSLLSWCSAIGCFQPMAGPHLLRDYYHGIHTVISLYSAVSVNITAERNCPGWVIPRV